MSREGFSYQFCEAIVRRPGRSVIAGLRSADRGAPDFERFHVEHREYVEALQRAGVRVTVLSALEAFPDSVFIEDAALCLPEGIVILRPGAPSRTGEARVLATDLATLDRDVIDHESAGFVDGGDVLVTESGVFVGLSERTDQQGFEWLQSILADWGYRVRAVHTPAGVLHLKSDCCVLGGDTVLATRRLAATDCFASAKVVTVPPGEEAAANALRVNDRVLVAAGYPATAERIAAAGYTVEIVPVSQASLLDGGLSCMSLRLPAVASLVRYPERIPGRAKSSS
jgi:dimethylargininase